MIIGFGGIRSFLNLKPIELKKVNILVGNNSSGKSTFARMLPLLKQSRKSKSGSPILWYGEYVDFGDYKAAKNKYFPQNPMYIKYVIPDFNVEFGLSAEYFENPEQFSFGEVETEIHLAYANSRTRVTKYIVYFKGISAKFDITFSKDGSLGRIYINDVNMNDHLEQIKVVQTSEMPPKLLFFYTDALKSGGISRNIKERVDSHFKAIVVKLLGSICSNRISDSNLAIVADYVMSVKQLRLFSLSGIFETGYKLIDNGYDKESNKEFYDSIKSIILLSMIPELTSQINEEFTSELSGVSYIGPARARGERYYRLQELAVDEIDHDGKNLPVYLYGLHDSQSKAFSEWVEGLLGYGVRAKREGGHISLNVIRGDMEFNVADSGYGISQILPVLAQLYWAKRPSRMLRYGIRYRRDPIIVIEQPELHLHPADQSILADAVLSLMEDEVNPGQAKNRRPTKPTFIIETHSETLINKFGELVEEKKIDPSDVQVLVFDAKKPGNTRVSIANFEDDGALANWPIGFFRKGSRR